MSEPGPAAVPLVDEDASVRRAVARLLIPAGLRVETLESAAQFVEGGKARIAESLVGDLRMPGMSDLELCASASARAAEIQEIHERQRSLTTREREAMALVALGRLTNQLAYEIGTRETTIRVHRARVIEKGRLSCVAALVHLVDRLAKSARRAHHGQVAV